MTTGDDAVEDARLAASASTGDQPAFGSLMRRHKGPVYNVLRRLTGDPEDAHDLLQETFVAAWRSLGSFDRERSFAAWIRRIAINKGRDWQRRKAVRRLVSAINPFAHDAGAFVADPGPSPEDAAAGLQMLRQVDQAIAALPATLKEPLVLTVFDGLSQRQAAELLGISEKAVETRVARARSQLTRSIGHALENR